MQSALRHETVESKLMRKTSIGTNVNAECRAATKVA
jgi:hypothetical protein